MDRVRLKRLIAYAMNAGAKAITPFEWEWDVSGRCATPLRRDIAPRAHRTERILSYKAYDSLEDTFRDIAAPPGPVTVTPLDPGPYVLHLTVRCRKCDTCRKERATMWAHRAKAEIRSSIRTWFGTLTLRPEAHYIFQCRAQAKSAKRAVDFDALTAPEKFDAVCQEIGKELTLILKRLRKAGHAFRYIVVWEPHKSGLPHLHILLHEIADPMRKAQLDKAWPFGFGKWKLAEPDHAWYISKYIAKTGACRVRASIGYGGTRSKNHSRSKSDVPILTSEEPGATPGLSEL